MFQGGTRNLPGRNRDVTPYQDRVIFSFTLAPPGFVGKAEKARREAAAKEERRAHCGGSETSRGSRCPRKIGPDPDCRPPRFLSMTELEALDREVLADPEVRASYEKQFPGFRRGLPRASPQGPDPGQAQPPRPFRRAEGVLRVGEIGREDS